MSQKWRIPFCSEATHRHLSNIGEGIIKGKATKDEWAAAGRWAALALEKAMEDANAAAEEAMAMAEETIAAMTKEAVIYALVREPGKKRARV